MKAYNCPDCSIETNSCNGCPRVEKQYTDNKTNVDVDWSKFNIYSRDTVPDPCKYCATHPSNGGDGICWCVLGVRPIY